MLGPSNDSYRTSLAFPIDDQAVDADGNQLICWRRFAIICGTEAQEATSVPAAANFAARRPNLAMRVTSLLLLLRHAAALSAPRPRVAVVGPAGDTVADAVAVRLK